MKYIVLIAALFVVVYGDYVSDIEDAEKLIDRVRNTLTTGKNDTSSSEESDKESDIFNKYCTGGIGREHIKNATLDTAECIDKIDFNKTLCTLFQTSIPDCLTPLTELFTSCLKEGGKTLPKFAVEIGKAVGQYICTSTGEYIVELLNPCIIEETDALYEIVATADELFKKYKDGDVLPSKDYTCGILKDIKENFTKHVKSVCFNPVTQATNLGVYDAIISPCEAKSAVDNKID